MSAAGYSVVFYLYYFQLISEYYFYSFLLTQVSFFIGLNFFKMPKVKSEEDRRGPYLARGIAGYLYLISFFLFLILQIVVYYYNGLPVFMDSRLEIFSGGSGFGIIGRVIYVTSTISLVISSYSLIFKDSIGLPKLLHGLVLLFYVFVAIVSGSKGALLLMIFIISLMLYFSRKRLSSSRVEKKANKILIFILFLVFPAALFTVIIQSGLDSYAEVAIAIAMRFIHTGQIFYMTYPNDILFSFPEANGFIALFRDIFGSLRIISWDELPVNHGLLAFQHHYPTIDTITGPNDRHNTFGLFYFGFFGSVIFSFLMGFIVSYIRNFLYKRLSFNLINMSLYALLVMAANNLNQDPSGMAVGYFYSIGLVFTPLFFISYMFFEISKKGKTIERNIFNTYSL
tara:strand:- start:151 stop:1344 length:1194 start_codon:yes stop_codon:yes gene_type:complete